MNVPKIRKVTKEQLESMNFTPLTKEDIDKILEEADEDFVAGYQAALDLLKGTKGD